MIEENTLIATRTRMIDEVKSKLIRQGKGLHKETYTHVNNSTAEKLEANGFPHHTGPTSYLSRSLTPPNIASKFRLEFHFVS